MLGMPDLTCDALVIGGGFFGCEVALELSRLGFDRIVLAEREPAILRRASFVNQARVHNGYHYPRSFATAVRSRRSFERFATDYAEAVVNDFQKVYAIARGSKVSASQFTTFCDAIGAPCRPASNVVRRLFDHALIEDAFLAQEFAFDACRLAAKLCRELAAAKVDVRLEAPARVTAWNEWSVSVDVAGSQECAGWLFNCTYSELGLTGAPLRTRIKKELAEMVLIKPPLSLAGLGVTVMDGPYFSTMPFPAVGLHSLSHVRYTPHEASSAVAYRPGKPIKSNRDYMIRDAARYMPHLAGAKVVDSIFEVKAVLSGSEADDGRPIVVERHEEAPRILSILGAKIDNIFDVRDYLSHELRN